MNLHGFGDNHLKVKGQRSINVQKPVKMMINFFCSSHNLRTTRGMSTKLRSIMYIDSQTNLFGFGDNHLRVKGQRSINVQNPVKMMRNFFCYSDNLRTNKGITTKLGSIMYIDREMNL